VDAACQARRARIWSVRRLKPRKVDTVKLSNDARFEEQRAGRSKQVAQSLLHCYRLPEGYGQAFWQGA